MRQAAGRVGYLRMSQINGCAFCLGINAVVLRAGGIRTMIWLLNKERVQSLVWTVF